MKLEITAHIYLHDAAQLDRIETLLTNIFHLGEKSMSAISDFAAKQKAYNDRQAAAINSVVTSVSNVTDDMKILKDKIDAFQNSPGAISTEDQALLDDLQSHAEGMTSKAEAAAAAIKALDDLTPPAVPADTGGGAPTFPPV